MADGDNLIIGRDNIGTMTTELVKRGGGTYPALGVRNEDGGYGIIVHATSTSAVNGDSITGDGVAGFSTSGGNGVYGESDTGTGVTGISKSGVGVTGTSESGVGVSGNSSSASGVIGTSYDNDGVYGESQASTGVGGSSTRGVGVYGVSSMYGNNFGVVGIGPNAGVAAFNLKNSNAAYLASGCCAAYFTGNVAVLGTLTKSGGGFEIDHPLDPASKLLTHSFVESSDRKNVYDGLAKLDAKGEATIKLPAWFEAVNRDYRYQLTAVGGPAPNLHIARKMKAGQFRIAGGKPRSEISWQVTGIRRDPWARAHPLVVEEKKPAGEKGYYLDPALYGMPQEKSVSRKRHPEPPKKRSEILKRRSKESGGTRSRKHRT